MDRLIVITDPEYFDGEAALLNGLFKAGLKRLHLRKPERSSDKMRHLVSQISPEFKRHISLHYHSDLVSELNVGGGHYSFVDILRGAASNSGYRVSCSVHSWHELKDLSGAKINYCLISPVYDSVSKQGYLANKSLHTVPDFAKKNPVYALGGINPSNVGATLENGYYGVAVLGYLWKERENIINRFELLKKEMEAYAC